MGATACDTDLSRFATKGRGIPSRVPARYATAGHHQTLHTSHLAKFVDFDESQ